MKKLFALLLILAAICAGAIYMLPSTLTKVSQTVLSEVFQTEVKVNGIDFSLLDGTFTIAEVTVKDYPKFGSDNLFLMKNLFVTVDAKSLMTNVITIEEILIEDLELSLTGGITNNSLKEIKHIISLHEELEEQEHAEHMASTEDHSDHHHDAQPVKFRINKINLPRIAASVKITEPFDLNRKQVVIKDVKLINITGPQGSTVHETAQNAISLLDSIITEKLTALIPAQKTYEDAENAVNIGIEKSKKFFKETFNEENAEKTKQKADELINKYF